jgi:hypothetical protein
MNAVIAKILASKEGILVLAVICMLGLNAVLTAAKKWIDRIKDKTATQVDDKASVVLGQILSVLSKVIEFMTANTTVLPDSVKAELEKKD